MEVLHPIDICKLYELLAEYTEAYLTLNEGGKKEQLGKYIDGLLTEIKRRNEK